jgi:hypothetical protein
MKSIYLSVLAAFCFFSCLDVLALQTAPKKGVTVNDKGASAVNSKGGGVKVKKGEVAAKGNKGNGVGIDKKGLEVKGTKGGMTIEKKSLKIKSKGVNVDLGGKK